MLGGRSHCRSLGIHMAIGAFMVMIMCLCCQLSTADDQQPNSLVLVPAAADDNSSEGNVKTVKEPLSDELFYPTEEWQTIKPGQSIPRGLHVRMNLETGEREAKLAELEKSRDPSDIKGKFNAWSHGDRHGMINPEKQSFSAEEIKRALKELKEDLPEGKKKTRETEGLRSYAELKRDFEEMNVGMKTDLEIIRELLSEYRLPHCTDERKLEILSDFEYYVHQIDNALNFVDMGGLDLVKEALNHTDVKFRVSSAFLVGSAAQSNPKVQVGAIERGILHHLVRQLPKESDEVATRRLLYALSAILRHFPYAQKKFIQLGGSEIFAQILSLEPTEDSLKQKLKIVALMTDLLAEKEAAEFESREEKIVGIVNTVTHDRLRQYGEIPLREELRARGCCTLVAQMLPTASEYDSQEKVLNALRLLSPHCAKDFPPATRDFLFHLKIQYEQNRSDPEMDDYLNNLLTTIDQIVERLPHSSDRSEL